MQRSVGPARQGFNILIFLPDKAPLLDLFHTYLKPGGRLILVEYNLQQGKYAVPYRLPYPAWERLAQAAGVASTRMLARRPSRFLHEIYPALSVK